MHKEETFQDAAAIVWFLFPASRVNWSRVLNLSIIWPLMTAGENPRESC